MTPLEWSNRNFTKTRWKRLPIAEILAIKVLSYFSKKGDFGSFWALGAQKRVKCLFFTNVFDLTFNQHKIPLIWAIAQVSTIIFFSLYRPKLPNAVSRWDLLGLGSPLAGWDTRHWCRGTLNRLSIQSYWDRWHPGTFKKFQQPIIVNGLDLRSIQNIMRDCILGIADLTTWDYQKSVYWLQKITFLNKNLYKNL